MKRMINPATAARIIGAFGSYLATTRYREEFPGASLPWIAGLRVGDASGTFHGLDIALYLLVLTRYH